jgi:hypothetical protein
VQAEVRHNRSWGKGTKWCNDHTKKDLAVKLLKILEDECEEEYDAGGFEKSFWWGDVSYLPVSGQMSIVYHKPGWPCMSPPQNPVLSDEGRSCLRQLTNGSVETLDNIAELVARLYQPERPSQYLWVISGQEPDRQQFVQWLLLLTNRPCGVAAYIQDENRRSIQLAEDQALGCPMQINGGNQSLDEFKKLNHSMLQKFVTGEVVGRLDDPYQTQQGVYGKYVLIWSADEPIEDSLGRIPHKTIHVPAGWSHEQLKGDREKESGNTNGSADAGRCNQSVRDEILSDRRWRLHQEEGTLRKTD